MKPCAPIRGASMTDLTFAAISVAVLCVGWRWCAGPEPDTSAKETTMDIMRDAVAMWILDMALYVSSNRLRIIMAQAVYALCQAELSGKDRLPNIEWRSIDDQCRWGTCDCVGKCGKKEEKNR